MEEKIFFEKLESIKLETGEVASHRRQLRVALLHARVKQNSDARNPLMKGVDNVLNLFTSKQPVWRVMLTSAVIIGEIGGFFITRSTTANEPQEKRVISILQSDPQFMNAIGSEDISTLKILGIRNDIATVAVDGTLAFVDLASEKVSSYHVIREDFTDAEKAQILHILNKNTITRTLLDEGASTKYVGLSFASSPFQNSAMIYPTDSAAWVSLTLSETQPFELNGVTFYEDRFNIWIDLSREEISPIEYMTYASLNASDLVEILGVLRADSRTSALLDEGAALISIVDLHTTSTIIVGVSNTNSATEKTAKLILKLNETYYEADVDIVGSKVTWFGEVGKP